MFSFLFFLLRGRWFFIGTLSPSGPDPCLVVVCVPLLLFCLVGFVAAVFSLLFSSSQALGKPKPPSGVWGLGFPLCFFALDELCDFDPYFFVLNFTTAKPRTCFFVFILFFPSMPSLVFRFGCFSRLSFWCVGGRHLSLSRWSCVRV